MHRSSTLQKRFDSNVEWIRPGNDVLFFRWSGSAREIAQIKQIRILPGQSLMCIHNSVCTAILEEPGLYDLQENGSEFWEKVQGALNDASGEEGVNGSPPALFFARTGELPPQSWNSGKYLRYEEPREGRLLRIRLFGSYRVKLVKPDSFFVNLGEDIGIYSLSRFRNAMTGRMPDIIGNFLKTADLSHTDFNESREELSLQLEDVMKRSCAPLGLEIYDTRIEGMVYANQTGEASAESSEHDSAPAVTDRAMNRGEEALGGHRTEQSSPGESDELVQRLESLKKMLDRKLISPEEYQAKKDEILTRL